MTWPGATETSYSLQISELCNEFWSDDGDGRDLPDDQHVCVHLVAQAFLCIWLEIESDRPDTFEQADYGENHYNPIGLHRQLPVG